MCEGGVGGECMCVSECVSVKLKKDVKKREEGRRLTSDS